MDALCDVLALLKSHRSTFAGLKAGGTWAINFAAPDGIKFNAVVEGSPWVISQTALSAVLSSA